MGCRMQKGVTGHSPARVSHLFHRGLLSHGQISAVPTVVCCHCPGISGDGIRKLERWRIAAFERRVGLTSQLWQPLIRWLAFRETGGGQACREAGQRLALQHKRPSRAVSRPEHQSQDGQPLRRVRPQGGDAELMSGRTASLPAQAEPYVGPASTYNSLDRHSYHPATLDRAPSSP